MQDRTINSALQALRKQGGHQGKLAATNRVYQALLRLEDKGKVVRDVGPEGCLWRLG